MSFESPHQHNDPISSLTDELASTSLEAIADHVFVDKIVFNHLIFETIFDNLTPLEFMRLGRTCQRARAVVLRFVDQKFGSKINDSLMRFFDDPVAFRSLQARTGTLISGSTALQFFDRTSYPNSDLDLYIHPQFDRDVLLWLTDNGYTFVPEEEQPARLEDAIETGRRVSRLIAQGLGWIIPHRQGEYHFKTIQSVYSFRKPSPVENEPDIRVQCMIAVHAPLEVILSFHSTCVMNVISFEKAYSLYPRATLHERRTFVNDLAPSPARQRAYQKYTERGFHLCYGTVPNSSGVDPAFPLGNRYIGDEHCWTIPLDISGVGPGCRLPRSRKPLLHDPVSASSWRFDRHARPFDVTVYSYCTLFFRYVTIPHAVTVYAQNVPRESSL
ncbi:hypothetical protein BXZ70DRAFT_898267 [Cristinia sonorae]|uniref:F-box domain-containing protein n=1 Tax=Cristinia sonorae TaxID=1940300 RepID=A0A8K0XM89_9AGAR|nr:hypothetical protein BXZ70DRAFT_898267 [Cristinia sonorae]